MPGVTRSYWAIVICVRLGHLLVPMEKRPTKTTTAIATNTQMSNALFFFLCVGRSTKVPPQPLQKRAEPGLILPQPEHRFCMYGPPRFGNLCRKDNMTGQKIATVSAPQLRCLVFSLIAFRLNVCRKVCLNRKSHSSSGYNLLQIVVAGAGFEPATFGL